MNQASAAVSRNFYIIGLGSERLALGVTQQQLGKVAGVSTWTISQVERGLRGCQRSTRDALMGALQRLRADHLRRATK